MFHGASDGGCRWRCTRIASSKQQLQCLRHIASSQRSLCPQFRLASRRIGRRELEPELLRAWVCGGEMERGQTTRLSQVARAAIDTDGSGDLVKSEMEGDGGGRISTCLCVLGGKTHKTSPHVHTGCGGDGKHERCDVSRPAARLPACRRRRQRAQCVVLPQPQRRGRIARSGRSMAVELLLDQLGHVDGVQRRHGVPRLRHFRRLLALRRRLPVG
mmetsp:Transcript_27679/g.60045  ORF Transcript_27679/g.60045 Transcript_27679/m.60045 type:complete len:216 (-) Transcript_27679:171-818(-)